MITLERRDHVDQPVEATAQVRRAHERPAHVRGAQSRAGRRGPASALAARLGPLTFGFGAIALLTTVRGIWAAELVLAVLLLVVPGLALLRALRMPLDHVVASPVYVVCASLVVLLASGLAVDLIGPVVGVAQPLRVVPLLIGLEVIGLALLIAGPGAAGYERLWMRLPRMRVRSLWPLLLPLASAAGAMRLTSGAGAAVAVVAMTAVVVTVIATVFVSPRMRRSQLALVVYSVALAAVWSYALRGPFVYGFDIASEYHTFHSTYLAGIWHPNQRNNAYGAMLSLTVLPSLLQALSGLSGLVVFKMVYPAIFALFPVGLFYIARRFLSARFAYLAAVYVVIQSFFGQQLPGVARQEIGLILFVGLIAVLVDRLPARVLWPLAGLFAIGLVVSHYSTAYLAILIVAVALMLQLGFGWLRSVPRVGLGTGAALLAMVLGVAVWYGPVTHSYSNVSRLESAVSAGGLRLLPTRTEGQSLLGSYLNGNTTTVITPQHYSKLVAGYYASQHKWIKPLPDADAKTYALQPSAPAGSQVRSVMGAHFLNLGSLLTEQLANLLAAIGVLWIALSRTTSTRLKQLALLGVASLGVLALLRLSGTLAQAYNQQRALLQLMVPLAIGMAWLLERIGRRLRPLAIPIAVLAASAIAVVFFSSSGLAGFVVGGGTGTNLADHGDDYERFYVTAPELASASWLGKNVVPGQVVYSDPYGQLRIDAVTNISKAELNDLTPRTLDQHAWVYASATNVLDGRARGDFESYEVVFKFPAKFLSNNYNVVYTDGSSEVFHR